MIADIGALEQTQLERALCTLFLLPSAPPQLVAAVYAALQRDGGATGELHDAYETVAAAAQAGALPTPSNGHAGTPFRQVNPWQILHLRPDAPQAAIDAAYWLWRGDAPPVVLPPRVVSAETKAVPEPVVEDDELANNEDVLSLIEDFAVLSVYEELIGVTDQSDEITTDEISPLPLAGEGPGVRAETKGPGEGSDDPTLTAADGSTLPLSERPLRIGTHPACDVVVRAADRIEARVWRNKGRVLVHALGERGAVRLNGEPVTWAVLDGGDALQVGPASFRFVSLKTT